MKISTPSPPQELLLSKLELETSRESLHEELPLMMGETLNLSEAACFLKIHPVTMLNKANGGEIPGAKIGKRWVFIKVDLINHIRSKYLRQALQGETSEVLVCHSTNARIPLVGGSKSQSTEKQYSALLGRLTKPKP
jgi:hypothetical protein